MCALNRIRFFVRDGPFWSSAGVTAGIDLALALVEEDLGPTLALAVARYLVVFMKRPGGQAQFSTALSLQAADDEFGALHEWIKNHLADDQPPLRAGNRSYPGACNRAFASRRRPALVIGIGPAGEADMSALRFRVGGNHAPQLPSPASRDIAGLSRSVQNLTRTPGRSSIDATVHPAGLP